MVSVLFYCTSRPIKLQNIRRVLSHCLLFLWSSTLYSIFFCILEWAKYMVSLIQWSAKLPKKDTADRWKEERMKGMKIGYLSLSAITCLLMLHVFMTSHIHHLCLFNCFVHFCFFKICGIYFKVGND